MGSNALYKLQYGLYIVGSVKEKEINAQIANTVFQITSNPPTIAVSINKQNLTHEYITYSKVFSIQILSKDAPMTFIGNFGFRSGRDIDKFKEIKYKLGTTSSPIVLDHTVAYLEANVINEVNCGTHTIFIGKLVGSEIMTEGEPMTYAYYHEVKKGKAPKAAPTYSGDNP